MINFHNKFFKFILVVFCVLCSMCNAQATNQRIISEIYIEASGNNIYEAKVKAHKYGMRRALMIIADKLGVNNQNIRSAPYLALKNTFTIEKVHNEKKTNDYYSAVVNYSYNLQSINQLLLEYGNSDVEQSFYDYLVIPIFKQKNNIIIWDNKQPWIEAWSKYGDVLKKYKMLYPQKFSDIISKISAKNVMSLSYDDFLLMFENILLKKVLLVTCEYFTDNTGEYFMEITRKILSSDDNEVNKLAYQVDSNLAIPFAIDKAIIDTVKYYQTVSVTSDIKSEIAAINQQILEEKLKSKESNTRVMHFNLDVFDERELQLVLIKLNSVSVVDNVSVSDNVINGEKKYIIELSTTSSDAKLEEEFYMHGLSFKIYGNFYNLINIQKGG